MKRALAFLLAFTAWQTGCSERSSSVTTSALPLLDAELSQKASVVAVQAERGLDEQLCTGVLVLPNLVLTARHCLTLDQFSLEGGDCKTALIAPPDAATRVTVVHAKDVDLATESERHAVKSALLPDDARKLCGQDLALLELAEPINDPPLLLTTDLPKAGTYFTAVGYGLADGDHGQQRATESADIMCLGSSCDDPRLASNELLAKSGACAGDSGGPALNGAAKVFALASRSTNDCSETTYVSFTEHFRWLSESVRQAAYEGDFALPEWAELPKPAAETRDDSATTKPDLTASGGCSLSLRGFRNAYPVLSLATVLFALLLSRRRRA